MPLVISLGSWCRPAWQIRRYYGTEMAYPFDWNITSFDALMHVLDPQFDPQMQLQIEDCVVNPLSSVTDMRTGWIHHHDLPAEAVGGATGSIAMDDSPEVLRLLRDTASKSTHLFRRMREHCQANPVVFVRWLRGGHPDPEFAGAFKDENPYRLHARLKEFCGHENVRIVYLISKVVNDEETQSACTLSRTAYGAHGQLVEAIRNFRSESWTGDDQSWTALFDAIGKDFVGLDSELVDQPSPH